MTTNRVEKDKNDRGTLLDRGIRIPRAVNTAGKADHKLYTTRLTPFGRQSVWVHLGREGKAKLKDAVHGAHGRVDSSEASVCLRWCTFIIEHIEQVNCVYTLWQRYVPEFIMSTGLT